MTQILPPQANSKPAIFHEHGIQRIDNYAWLRSAEWQEVMQNPDALEPDIRAYLDAENAYQDSIMCQTKPLQEILYSEMRGRIKEDDNSAPLPDGPYLYGTKFITDGQYPHFIRQSQTGGDEVTLLNGDKEAKGKSYFSIGGTGHSPDHKLFYWSSDDKGSEYYAITLRDTKTRKDRNYRIQDTSGGFTFSADGQYGFYVRLDDSHRPSKVFRHKIDTNPSEDVLIFEESDPGFFVSVGKTLSRRTILITTSSHQTSEVWRMAADEPLVKPTIIAKRENEIEYFVEEHADTFYILTNAQGSEDFSIVTTPKNAPSRENWKQLVPHKTGRLIQHMFVLKNYIIRLEREDGLPHIIIHDLSDGSEHAVSFDEEAYSLGFRAGYEFDTSLIRFSYSSMTTPSQVFDYDIGSRQRKLRKEQEIPSGHNARDYVTRRIFATAHDGETIPISLVHYKDTVLDGSAPCLLYGYGSYGMSMPSGFNSNALSLVNRGFVYAIAHVRGGKEKGFRWYKEGRRDLKTNTFKDFIAATDHLVAQDFTRYDNIIAQGGSAGGMLMGAIANIAPEKFAGIIAQVPFVDVLATILDETLPLTPPEWPEWGNPIKDKAAYDLISSYSPYDNVSVQAYPSIFALAGLTDPRVTYWEPAKWVAKLRAMKTDDNQLLLKTNMGAGHAGASGRFDYLKEVALVQAFALMTVRKAD